MKKKIIITGGAGYIGLHCAVSVAKNNYEPILIDNFSNSFEKSINNLNFILKKKIKYFKIDLNEKKKLKLLLKKEKNIDAVIHCAALKSVEESTQQPIKYFQNNIQSSLNLIECMKEARIFKLIFSSSATVYNINQKIPLDENSQIGSTLNPYGTSKYIIERILMDVAKFDKKWKIGIARYFNPIGNHNSGLLKEKPKSEIKNLLPCIVDVMLNKRKYLKIFGKNYKTKDGTCIRDYIHVVDLADAHVALLKSKKFKNGVNIYNFGTGKGNSVLEILRTFENVSKYKIPSKYVKKRDGDAPISVCSVKKSNKDLNWRSKLTVKDAIVDLAKIRY